MVPPYIISERQFAVFFADFGEVRVSAGGCGSSVAGIRSTVSGSGAIIAATLTLGIPEVDVVGDDFSTSALTAVAVGPVADLQSALHHGHAALGEVLADKLGSVAPGNNVDEIGLLLAALRLEVAVNGQREGSNSSAGLRATQLGVTGQTPHQDDLIQHPDASSVTRPCRRSGNA